MHVKHRQVMLNGFVGVPDALVFRCRASEKQRGSYGLFFFQTRSRVSRASAAADPDSRGQTEKNKNRTQKPHGHRPNEALASGA